MNSDSFFESEFFQQHKGLMTLFITVTLAFVTIYWLYRGLKSDGNLNQNNPNNQNLNNALNNTATNNYNSTQIVKRRLTISANDILFKDINDIDISYVYQILDKLSSSFDLYLIILIDEKDDTENIIEKFSVLVEDKIIFKHVIYIIYLC
jgi:hypothetical protein